MFVYCAHCGMIIKKSKQTVCPICDIEFSDVPAKYLSASGNLFLSNDMRKQFVEEIIITNPQYNESLALQRDEILLEQEKKKKEEVAQKVYEYQSIKPTLRCPVCGSNNLSNISTIGKVAKISLIGIWGAGDLGKKRRCNTCGHKF